jgi:hypothetical protein
MQDGVYDKKNGEQPAPAVLLEDFQPLAKPAKSECRRTLPHLQVENKPHLSKKILQQNQKILDIQSGSEIVNKY